METETLVMSENNLNVTQQDLEAIIKATVEKTIANLFENKEFADKNRGRSRSRSKDRSRSGSRSRHGRCSSRGKRNRSRGRRDRSRDREERSKFNSEREDYGRFSGPFGHHHHFHHGVPWTFGCGDENNFSFRRGRWGKFGRKFHRCFYLHEPNEQSDENKENAEKSQQNGKGNASDVDRDFRNDFEHLDVHDVIRIN